MPGCQHHFVKSRPRPETGISALPPRKDACRRRSIGTLLAGEPQEPRQESTFRLSPMRKKDNFR